MTQPNSSVSNSVPQEPPGGQPPAAPQAGLLRIIWFSCLFFLALFSFYAWKLFITEDPRPVTWVVPVVFYFLGVMTYALGELAPQRKLAPDSKVPPEFPLMISYSLFEAVGLYGLIYAVLTQSFLQSFVFLFAAYLGLFRHRPQNS